MINLDDLITFYISLKRIFFNIPFLRKPKEGSRQYQQLLELLKIIAELEGNYEDYILLQVRLYHKKHLFPSPGQLIGQRAIDRYKQYLKIKEVRHGKRFILDKDSVYIIKTGLYYLLDEFKRTMEEDAKFAKVATCIKEGKTYSNIDLDKEYLLAKYDYLHKTPPGALLIGRKDETNKE